MFHVKVDGPAVIFQGKIKFFVLGEGAEIRWNVMRDKSLISLPWRSGNDLTRDPSGCGFGI